VSLVELAESALSGRMAGARCDGVPCSVHVPRGLRPLLLYFTAQGTPPQCS